MDFLRKNEDESTGQNIRSKQEKEDGAMIDLEDAGEDGAMIVLEDNGAVYQDTAIPLFQDRQDIHRGADFLLSVKKTAPGMTRIEDPHLKRLHEMRRMYVYGRESLESKARNFVRQAAFMEDYEDDYPWSGSFFCYFPTYQDMTLNQLRGYFTWRTKLRNGEYTEIAASAVYLYIYELLNGIGADSPEDALAKMNELESCFLNQNLCAGADQIKKNLRRWMLDFAIIKYLPAEIARKYADPEMLLKDEAYPVLKNPEAYTDEEVFNALCLFGDKKLAASPVACFEGMRGIHLICKVWRMAAASYTRDGSDLFTACFGKPMNRTWYPLKNALYYPGKTGLLWGYGRPDGNDSEYFLTSSRMYFIQDGIRTVRAYENLYFDRYLFRGILHETDARLRRYLKTGRYLKEKPEDSWAVPYIEQVIDEDRRERLEASRPKISIDLTNLEQIRTDAGRTRDSLLTEEERKEFEGEAPFAAELDISAEGGVLERRFAEEGAPEGRIAEGGISQGGILEGGITQDSIPEEGTPEGSVTEASLSEGSISVDRIPAQLPDPALLRIVRLLLGGEDPSDYIRENHLMPSIVADEVNEAFYEEIGDLVLCCIDDHLTIVEDYRDELERLTGPFFDV